MIWLVIGILILLSVFGGYCFALVYSYNNDPFVAGWLTACCLGIAILVVTGIGLAAYGLTEVIG